MLQELLVVKLRIYIAIDEEANDTLHTCPSQNLNYCDGEDLDDDVQLM